MPILLELLADARTNVQEAAAESLRAMTDPRGRMALVEALGDRYEWTRVIAAKALAVEQEPAAWPALEAALDSDDVDVYGPAMDGIWLFDRTRAIALTETIARERDEVPFLREMAVRALGHEGTARSLSAVESALSDRQRYVRRAAQQAIQAIRARAANEGRGVPSDVRDDDSGA